MLTQGADDLAQARTTIHPDVDRSDTLRLSHSPSSFYSTSPQIPPPSSSSFFSCLQYKLLLCRRSLSPPPSLPLSLSPLPPRLPFCSSPSSLIFLFFLLLDVLLFFLLQASLLPSLRSPILLRGDFENFFFSPCLIQTAGTHLVQCARFHSAFPSPRFKQTPIAFHIEPLPLCKEAEETEAQYQLLRHQI